MLVECPARVPPHSPRFSRRLFSILFCSVFCFASLFSRIDFGRAPGVGMCVGEGGAHISRVGGVAPLRIVGALAVLFVFFCFLRLSLSCVM